MAIRSEIIAAKASAERPMTHCKSISIQSANRVAENNIRTNIQDDKLEHYFGLPSLHSSCISIFVPWSTLSQLGRWKLRVQEGQIVQACQEQPNSGGGGGGRTSSSSSRLVATNQNASTGKCIVN